jgi:SAM-dependent methyltransferase
MALCADRGWQAESTGMRARSLGDLGSPRMTTHVPSCAASDGDIDHASPAGPMALQRFMTACADSLTAGTLSHIVLAKNAHAASDWQRVTVRPLLLRGVVCLSFVDRHATRELTRHLPPDEGWKALRELLGSTFRAAHLHTASEHLQLSLSRRGQGTLRRSASAPGEDQGEPSVPLPSEAHDRVKTRWVDVERPFLHALGVTDAEHRVLPSMSRKWKQINKFVEIVAGAIESAGLTAASGNGQARALRVIDFGSGKGYLTFALHDHLLRLRGVEPKVTGIDLRADMVSLCSAVASRLHLRGLSFEQGDVRARPAEALDVVIALHACDIATDHAMALGVRGGAAVIVCSPCCHQQLRPQLLSPHPMRPLLRHGVHLGQQAEMLTDGLRAMLLEACGYATQVFEFVALEHSQKNKMILAVRRDADAQAARPEEVVRQIGELKDFYSVREHCLETLLRAERLLPAAPGAG